ncbi:serine-rich adhesin for platelets-like isoform X2 [Centroberyx affinis]|uniref:serine-rich adhesin for platelets-like isoform X2 n=1 Tax=Centroberyx affinis TaxID=166261 RepID=UPI003A5BC4BB
MRRVKHGVSVSNRPEKSLTIVITSKIALHAMRSGYPQSHQGGVYPACRQHRRNNGALPSPYQNNVASEPLGYPALGYPAPFASQHPGGYRGVYSPGQRQYHFTQAPQNVPALHHRQDTQTSSPSTGFQHSVPMGDVFPLQNNRHPISREAKGEFNSSACVSAQHNRRFAMTANERSARQPMARFSGESRESCNVPNSWEGSNMNNNTRLAQTQHLNPAISKSSSSAGLQGVSLNMAAQTFPVRDQPSHVPVRKPESFPLLTSMLTATPSCNTSFNTSQQAKSLPPALKYGQPRHKMFSQTSTQKDSHPTSHKQHSSSPSLSSQLSIDKVLPTEKRKIFTDGEILDFIAETLEYFKSNPSHNKPSNGRPDSKEGQTLHSSKEDSTLCTQNQPDCRSIMPKAESVAPPLHNFNFTKSFTVGGEACEEDHSKESKENELTLKAKKDDWARSTTEKHSTEYPHIMLNVAATCTKNEDKSPVVLTTVSGMTVGELIEKHPVLTVNCHSLQEEYTSGWLNINKNLDDIDREPGVSLALKYIPEKVDEARSRKPFEAVQLENVQGVTSDVSEDRQAKSSSVLSEKKTLQFSSVDENQQPGKQKNVTDPQHDSVTGKEGPQYEKVIPHSKLSLPVSEKQIHNSVSLSTNQSEGRCIQTNRNDTQFVNLHPSSHPQTELRIELSENKCEGQAPPSRNKGEGSTFLTKIKDPQYEDITDDENPPNENVTIDSQLTTQLSNNKNEGSSFPTCFKVLQYEDITDDENENQDATVGPHSVSPMSEYNSDKSPSGNQGHGHEQALAEMQKDVISDGEQIPKKQILRRTERHDSAQKCCCPYFVETDDGFEKQLCPKCETERELGQETKHSLFAPLSDDGSSSSEEGMVEAPKEPVSQTVTGLQNKGITKVTTSQYDVVIKTDGLQHQKVTDSKDPQCEQLRTVDESQQNEDLTADDFLCDDKTEDEMDEENWMVIPIAISDLRFESTEVTQGSPGNVPEYGKSGEKQRQAGRILSRSELHCSTMPALVSTSDLDVFETVGSFLQAKMTKTPGRTTPSPEIESETEPQTPRSSRQSSSCETEDSDDYSISPSEHRPNYLTVSRQCWDKKIEPNILHLSQRKELLTSVCIPESESESDDECTNVQKSQKRIISTLETDSADESGCMGTSRQLIESKAGSEHIQHKMKRRKILKKRTAILESVTDAESGQIGKKKAKRRRLFSSGSEDSPDDRFIPQNRHSSEPVDNHCRTAGEKPQQTRLSSEKSRVPQHQSVDREESSILAPNPVIARPLAPNPVIPRLIVQTSSDSTNYLKLSKESTVHKQGNDETQVSNAPIKNSKKNDKKYTPQSLGDKKIRFVSNDKPASCSRGLQTKKISESEAQAPVKRRSFCTQDGPSASRGSLASTKGHLSDARESSASSRESSASSNKCLSKAKQGPSISRGLSSSKVQRSNSSETLAWQHMRKDWQNFFIPTSKDKKNGFGTKVDFRTSPTHSKSTPGREHYDAGRVVNPGPSHCDRLARQRHKSHESAAPLMKKSIDQAKRLTAIHRNASPYERRGSVGEGYKWTDKRTTANKTKGYSRERKRSRSPPEPYHYLSGIEEDFYF